MRKPYHQIHRFATLCFAKVTSGSSRSWTYQHAKNPNATFRHKHPREAFARQFCSGINMRSYISIHQRRLRRMGIHFPIIPITLLILTIPYLITIFTTVKIHESYISPSARAILTSHNHPLNENPSTFKKVIIYRSLGNSLPPRHASNQTYTNLLFLLRHEPELPYVEKRWYINRLLDTREEARIINLLLTHRQIFFIDSLNWQNYRTLNTTINPGDKQWWRKNIQRFPKRVAGAWMGLLKNKNRFVMHCNGARNNMLNLGFSAGAKFVLPCDGNIFFTDTAWGEVISKLGNAGYYAIPMTRIAQNSDLMMMDGRHATEEPQILFRRGAKERFDEGLVYGRAPKLELLERLSRKRLLQSIGWCVRLADGSGGVMDGTERAMNRYEGVERALAFADWLAFDKLGNGHGFDIAGCMGKLRGFQRLSMRNLAGMQESDFCDWSMNTIDELLVNESRTLTNAEKIRIINMLDVVINHGDTDCIPKKMGLLKRWCGGHLELVKQWERGWWLLRSGLDGALTAFCGVVVGDYRFAARIASAVSLGKKRMDDMEIAEWIGCVEHGIARRFSSVEDL